VVGGAGWVSCGLAGPHAHTSANNIPKRDVDMSRL
jgi:hypothetical protein